MYGSMLSASVSDEMSFQENVRKSFRKVIQICVHLQNLGQDFLLHFYFSNKTVVSFCYVSNSGNT